MSRIGKVPVEIPSGVKCELSGSHFKVTGPKGVLERDLSAEVTVTVSDGEVVVTRATDRPKHRALHGLTRALIQNMVVGVTHGYERVLVISGVGYRASLQGKTLNLSVGYSSPVSMDPPEGVTYAVENPTTIRISGIDKERVGQAAADVRAVRKPEPYKGKGIRYENEHIRRKVGKAGAK